MPTRNFAEGSGSSCGDSLGAELPPDWITLGCDETVGVDPVLWYCSQALLCGSPCGLASGSVQPSRCAPHATRKKWDETCRATQSGETFWSRFALGACLLWMSKEKEHRQTMLGDCSWAAMTLTQASLRRSQRQHQQFRVSHLPRLGYRRTTQELRQRRAALYPRSQLLSPSQYQCRLPDLKPSRRTVEPSC